MVVEWPNLKKREGKGREGKARVLLNLSWWAPSLLQGNRRAELSCELQEEDCVLPEFSNSPALPGRAGGSFRDLPGLGLGTTLYFLYFCFQINYFDIAEKRK